MQESQSSESKCPRTQQSKSATVTELRATNLGRGGNARYDARCIFRGGREVEIVHNGAEYRLRMTAAGKLILTK